MKKPSIKKKEYKKTTIKKEDGWSLSSFNEALSKSFDDKRKKDAATAKKLQEELPQNIKDLRKKKNADLFKLYDTALMGGFSSTEIMKVLVEWKDAIKTEMLRRMK